MHDFTSALDNGKERNAAEGSGCGSVGRVVASNSRGLRFESSLRQKFILNFYCQLCIEKTKIKEKRPGLAHLKKVILKNVDCRLAVKRNIGFKIGG